MLISCSCEGRTRACSRLSTYKYLCHIIRKKVDEKSGLLASRRHCGLYYNVYIYVYVSGTGEREKKMELYTQYRR